MFNVLFVCFHPPTPAGGSAPEKPGLCEFACCNLSSRSLCFSAVSGALGGPQCHLLEDLESLGPSVTCCTLSSYLFMHSLGDVWHLGSEDLESLQVLGPCYLYAFLR